MGIKSDFVSTKIKIKAKNSSGKQNLSITGNDEFYWLTLWGKYNGKEIQIDFDEMTKKEFKKFIKKCQKIIKTKFKKEVSNG